MRTWTPNLMATLYYAEHVHITQTRNQIPTPFSCMGHKSDSESVPVPESGNMFKPLVALKTGKEKQA